MKILLTGASSYVGARLYFDLHKKFDIIGTYNGSKLSNSFLPLDITNPIQIQNILQTQKPDIILHAAANANARWCEANPEQAIILNQTSTQKIVEEANKIHAKIIYISSFAAINPENIYGRTKLASEAYVKETKAGYVILRPSLIIGYSPNTINDRPFNRILKNIDEKTPPSYDTSWKFQPTYLHHLSEVIEQIIEKNITNDIIPVAVADIKSRYDLAKDILSAFNITALPEDKKDTSAVTIDNLNKLKEYNLPQYTYQEMIKSIIEEIHNRKNYILD